LLNNIYGHQSLKNQFSQLIIHKTLPSGLLFAGPRFSGRLTTAKEIARVVSCLGTYTSECTCENCRNSRAGIHPYTIMLLSRDLTKEILAAYDSYRKKKFPDTALLLIIQVRKLLSRYRADLIEDSTAAAKTLMKTAFEIDELIMLFLEEKNGSGTLKLAGEIVKKSKLLSSSVKSGNIPVSQIRKIASWIYSAPGNQVKCIIIEGIEGITDASKNALLKILEEPPANTYFILIAESIGRIPQTILSRVRRYHFVQLDENSKNNVIQEIYLDDPDLYDSLKTFFMTKSGVNCRELHDDAEIFFLSAMNRSELSYKDFQSMLFKINSGKLFPDFISEIVIVLEQEVEDRLISRENAARILTDIKTISTRRTTYNQHSALALETLYNTIRIGLA
jgi:DNA polymerase III delta prime subunit